MMQERASRNEKSGEEGGFVGMLQVVQWKRLKGMEEHEKETNYDLHGKKAKE